MRNGNLIELALDYDEGISNSVAVNCIKLSSSAKSSAKKNFPYYWDSAQHFIWNFLMTTDESKATARTIANNHEWGIAMINPMLNHYKQAYDRYISNGYNDDKAASKAVADTFIYAPEFKYDAVCVMETSYNYFKSFLQMSA